MKYIKKMAIFSIILLVILLTGQNVKAYEDKNKKGTTFTVKGNIDEEDWRYSYFCWDHGKDAPRSGNIMTYDHSEVYRSDDVNVLKKAYILNEAIKADRASYSRDGYLNKTKYQLALWKELGYGLSANDGRIGEANTLYANAEQYKGETYSTDSCRCSTGKVLMDGDVGSLKIETLVGNIISIKYNNSNSKLTVYRNQGCTNLITKYEDIKAGDTIYFKNENAAIQSLQIEAECAASGYKILAHFYKCDNNSRQRLVKVEKVEGVSSSQSISLEVQYTTGSLEIRKQGVTISNSNIISTEKITATFKLFCTEENKWVVGNPGDMKSYTSNFENATEYTTTDNNLDLVTNIVIDKLEAGKHYEVVEIDVGNHAYKKSSGLSEIYSVNIKYENANLKISTKSVNNKAYPSIKENDNGIEVKPNQKRRLIVKNKKKNGNLTIKKVDYDYNVPLNGAKFAVYCTANGGGWLGYNETNQEVTYGKTWANKYEFITGNSYCGDVKVDGELSIENLIQGRYVVFEIATPDGYNLKDQPGYLYNDFQAYVEGLNNYGSDDKDAVLIGTASYRRGYVSLKDGTAKSNRLDKVNDVIFNTDYGWNNENNSGYTSSNLTYTIKNKKQTKLTINKTDAKDAKKLKDVGLKVLVKLYEKVQYDSNILDVNTWGWLKQDGTVTTKYSEAYEFITDQNGNIELLNIPYGIYYIYETTTGAGYELVDQMGYKMDKPKNLNGEFFKENEEYVFLGSKTINKPEYIPEIKNGIYKISSKINSDMLLEVPSSYIKEGVRIQTFADNNSIGQMFMIEYAGDGYYTIRSLISAKYLDVKSGQIYNNAQVWQYRYNGSDAQLWRFSKQEDGSYSITSKVDNRYCIDIPGGKDESNLEIQMYLRNDTPAQKFNLLRQDGTNGQTNEEAKMNVKEGEYEIQSIYKPENYVFALDIAGNLAEDKANLRLYQANNTDAQKFNIIYVGGGNYIIQKKYTKGNTITYKVLTVDDSNITQDSTTLNKCNIYQMPYEITNNYYDFNGNKWRFEYNKEEEYYIKSKMNIANKDTQFYMDIEGGTSNINKAKNAIKNNTSDQKWVNIQLYENNNSPAQKFLLNKVDNTNLKYGNREETIEVKNKQSIGSLTITKQDPNTKEKLVGTEFKLYATNINSNIIAGGKGWVTLNNGQVGYSSNYNDANSFTTNNEGIVLVENLSYGTYYIYETKAPAGYNIKDQDSYHVAQEGSTTIPQDQDWVALGNRQISSQKKDEKVTLNNQKYIKVKGRVWEDNPDGKANTYNNIYDGNDWTFQDQNITRDRLIEGITVNLYSNKNGKDELISTTTTGNNGEYEFEKKTNGQKLTYLELENCYVEFVYDNTQYVLTTPFVGDDLSINSKAQAKEIITTGGEHNMGELYDGNLGLNEGKIPGKAVTYQGNANQTQRKLTEYYNNETNTIENINLGLVKKLKNEFAVNQELEYVKIVRGNYTFTYKYGANAVIDEDAQKTQSSIAFQNSARTFTHSVYPSDIKYNIANRLNENDDNAYKIYVVYKIGVKNTTSHENPDLYQEDKLYLTSLVDNYDTSRLLLSADEIGNDAENEQFKLWSNNDGQATYNLTNTKNVYKDGLAKNETIESYIQFKVTQSALTDLITKSKEELKNIFEKAPTKVNAKGYHIYKRNDKNWKDKELYTHRTTDSEANDGALFIKWTLADTRKISGVVFEDTKVNQLKDEEGNSRKNERIGNGKLDINDDGTYGEKTISDVIVSLMDADAKDKDKEIVAKVYNGDLVQGADGKWKATSRDAIVKVKDDGSYEIPDVVPGRYYLKFTYGNGETEYTDLNGKKIEIATKIKGQEEAIKSYLYKSTILTGAASQANSTNEKTWFLDSIKDGVYSIAVDNDTEINNRINNDILKVRELNYEYTNSLTSSTISANSPVLDIQFEYIPETEIEVNLLKNNDPTKEKPLRTNCTGMSFGIIERPHVNIELEKTIKTIKLILQNGTIIINGDPRDSNVSPNLASINDSNAKLELDTSYIYGSNAVVTYSLSAHNKSELDYATPDYYKYGDKNNSTPITTMVTNIVDYINNQNASYVNQSEGSSTLKEEDKKTYFSQEVIEKNKNYKYTVLSPNKELIPEAATLDDLSKSRTDEYEFTVNNLLSTSDGVLGWESYAEIIGIKNITLTPQYVSKSGNYVVGDKSTMEPDTANATVSIYPSTGENRNLIIYYVIGGALLIIAGGIVLIKKFIINVK